MNWQCFLFNSFCSFLFSFSAPCGILSLNNSFSYCFLLQSLHPTVHVLSLHLSLHLSVYLYFSCIIQHFFLSVPKYFNTLSIILSFPLCHRSLYPYKCIFSEFIISVQLSPHPNCYTPFFLLLTPQISVPVSPSFPCPFLSPSYLFQ